MAEQLLHGAQIRATLQQMTGEGVAEHMRRDAGRLDAGGKRESLQLLAEALSGQMLAARLTGTAKATRPSPRLQPRAPRQDALAALRAPFRSAARAARGRLCP